MGHGLLLLCVWRTITNAISDGWHVVVSFIKVEDSISFPCTLFVVQISSCSS
jgi:hypothetical protein